MIRFLIILVFTTAFCSCQQDKEPEKICKDVNIDTLISVVASQKIVQDEIRLVDSLSNHTRKLSFQVRPKDSLDVIYLVKVLEDNGNSFTTHFNFLIDLRTLKILNPNGKLDEVTTRTCELTNLSNQFDISVYLKRFADGRQVYDSCILKLIIVDKKTKSKIDSTELTSLFLFSNTYENCDSVTSFSTNYKNNREIVDNYFGDIVVADFNFDNKDDVAFITDIGGNGGPAYCYYLQSRDKKFYVDRYLTDSVIYFPEFIDKKRQRLTTRVHAGACCVGVHIYQLNKSTSMWNQISHKIDSL
jgi:hypothetical protein